MNGEEIIILNINWLDHNDVIVEDDKKRIELYTKSSWFYEYINKQLREGKISKVTDYFVEDMVSLIQSARPYPKEICFYRGVTDYMNFIETLNPGDSFISRGFN